MKRILIILTMLMFCWASLSYADMLKWDHDGECVDGYIVYFNDFSIDVGNVKEYNIDSLDLKSCELTNFSVAAYNKAGASITSNEVPYVKIYEPPEAPENARTE